MQVFRLKYILIALTFTCCTNKAQDVKEINKPTALKISKNNQALNEIIRDFRKSVKSGDLLLLKKTITKASSSPYSDLSLGYSFHMMIKYPCVETYNAVYNSMKWFPLEKDDERTINFLLYLKVRKYELDKIKQTFFLAGTKYMTDDLREANYYLKTLEL